MLLPTKHLPEDRALLTVAGELGQFLGAPRTVSSLWHAARSDRGVGGGATTLGFDWFVLALDLLFALGAIELADGRLRRTQ